MRTRVVGAGLGLAVAMTLAAPANAAIITFTPDTEFSGSGYDYDGTITYTLEDVAGGVQFTIDWAPVTDTGQYLAAAYLNFDPMLDAATAITEGASSCTNCVFDSASFGNDAFQADGDGKFDMEFTFSEAQADRFNQGDSFSIFLGGSFTTQSFVYQSAVGGGNGTWYTAARVRGLGDDNQGSGWFGDDTPPGGGDVPEPASLTLLALGFALGAARLRARRQ